MIVQIEFPGMALGGIAIVIADDTFHARKIVAKLLRNNELPRIAELVENFDESTSVTVVSGDGPVLYFWDGDY